MNDEHIKLHCFCPNGSGICSYWLHNNELTNLESIIKVIKHGMCNQCEYGIDYILENLLDNKNTAFPVPFYQYEEW